MDKGMVYYLFVIGYDSLYWNGWWWVTITISTLAEGA